MGGYFSVLLLASGIFSWLLVSPLGSGISSWLLVGAAVWDVAVRRGQRTVPPGLESDLMEGLDARVTAGLRCENGLALVLKSLRLYSLIHSFCIHSFT